MRDGKATLEQIEAALLNDNIARRDEALDAAYLQIEQLRVLLSESMPQEQAIELRLEAGMYRSLYETAKAALRRSESALSVARKHLATLGGDYNTTEDAIQLAVMEQIDEVLG